MPNQIGWILTSQQRSDYRRRARWACSKTTSKPEGCGHQLPSYRSCSSPNQVPLQQPVINKQKARGTSWAVIKESTFLSYSSDKKVGHACTPILLLPKPHRLCPWESPWLNHLRLVFCCAVSCKPSGIIWRLLFCLQALK
ncbi:hypothetical protein PoB_004640400 [Plakobranchus ocellatus]|uniref:Uncharacterized protein n=1 Tax=Plakobranchus ocellatus TaxID=259542 RepID=A0AAV4BLW1_9GAST|nr:hypothetical protein PoB_004640400 [Plakobranchus ocellatus]